MECSLKHFNKFIIIIFLFWYKNNKINKIINKIMKIFGKYIYFFNLCNLSLHKMVFKSAYPVFVCFRITVGRTFAARLRSAGTPRLCSGTMWFISWAALSSSPSNGWTAIMWWRTAGTPNSDRRTRGTVWPPAPPKGRSTPPEGQKWVSLCGASRGFGEKVRSQ